jgi:hypothetical protein
MKRSRITTGILQLLVLAGCCCFTANAQEPIPVRDVGDVLRQLFNKKTDTVQKKEVQRPPYAILPSFGYNPSFGFVIGGKLSGGKQLGDPANTAFSIFGLEALFTSKGIVILKARHNIFTKGNHLNLQGDWQVSKFAMVDYGIGTGNSNYRSDGFVINEFPVTNADSAFPMKYNYIKLLEKVYVELVSHLYAGAGVSFDLYSNIVDEKKDNGNFTPHQLYSLAEGFDQKKYSANALFIALQFNNVEHPLRSYGGVYADLSLRFNQEWLGSTKDAVQVQYDLRKYFSLSKRSPEHVIALWHWASYHVSGTLPYLALPYTAYDTYNRSGRGYTLGRFKGPSFAYFETEYRFPITRNKLLSGVCFLNMQTASDGLKKEVFDYWEQAGGAGLRILFQKKTRSTLCIDVAKGKYGSWGIFFGLNEAF